MARYAIEDIDTLIMDYQFYSNADSITDLNAVLDSGLGIVVRTIESLLAMNNERLKDQLESLENEVI